MTIIEETVLMIKQHPDYEKIKKRPKWLNFIIMCLFCTVYGISKIQEAALIEAFVKAELI